MLERNTSDMVNPDKLELNVGSNLKPSQMMIKNTRCELVSGSDVSYLEGRLKTFIDAIIPIGHVVQNKATKDIIRVILWDWFNFITDHTTDHLQDKLKWYTKNKK